MSTDMSKVPGWEGSVGPFPAQYGQPHVYARSVHSGAGNCVCGHEPQSRRHLKYGNSEALNALVWLGKQIGESNIQRWTDRPTVTAAEVVATVRRVAS